MNPFISIIIPVYNSEKYLIKCINSIVRQTEPNFEAIFIDDGSTDSSASIINEFMDTDSRLKIFSQTNSGPGAARNLGIINSSGKYIMFLDADDYIEPDTIETLYKIIKKEESDFLFYGFIQEAENGSLISKNSYEKYASYTKKDLIKLLTLGKLPFGAFHVIKSSIIKEFNCYYSSLKQNEELIFKLKTILNSDKIAFTDYVPYHYIKHPVSLSKVYDPDLLKNDTLVLKEISDILHSVIDDSGEFNEIINTYRFNKLIIWGYTECKNTPLTITSFYRSFKKSFYKEKKMIDMASVNYSLLPLKVKLLSGFIRFNALFLFTILCFFYRFADNRKVQASNY
jgi:glycosyltransferase involved in cell wall biosynthesis